MSTYKPWADEIAVERGQGSRTAREDRHLYAVREIADSEWIGVVGGEAPGGADGWAKLFQAAPKMARAIIRALEGAACEYAWHEAEKDDCFASNVPPCRVCEMRAALRDAGVPLP